MRYRKLKRKLRQDRFLLLGFFGLIFGLLFLVVRWPGLSFEWSEKPSSGNLLSQDLSKGEKLQKEEVAVLSASLPSGDIAEDTVSPAPVLTPTLTQTPVPTQKPIPTPTLRPTITLPQPATAEQINGFIEKYAAHFSVDPNLLRHIALCESTFDPLASKLDYAGLYQFDQRTWGIYRRALNLDDDPVLRYDAEQAVMTAAYVLSVDRAGIWPSCSPQS